MFLLPAYLAIHLAFSIGSSNKTPDLLANLNHLNPPTDLKIVDKQFGEFEFFWNSNLTEDLLANYQVKYVFQSRYDDVGVWENGARLPQSQHDSTFELHRGVSIRIKNVLLSNGNVCRESNWTEKVIQSPGNPETLAAYFSCVLYNHSRMNCTWRPGSKLPIGSQYRMYYKYFGNTKECAHYFTDLQGRQGCHIDELPIPNDDPDEHVLICVNGSNNSPSISPYYVKLDTQLFEKYNPPCNVKIFPNLTVVWDKPPGYSIADHCFEYQLQLTELAGNNIESFYVQAVTKYILNINLSKRYSVKVRTKMKLCKETKYWSEWSDEVFIEPKKLFNGWVVTTVLIMIAAMMILLLSLIFRRYKDFIFRRVPDPQKNFKELFEEYNGDFQKWIGCQIPASKYEECATVVIEERTRPESQVKKYSSITKDLFTAEDYRHSTGKAVGQIS
ncbi:interleukin-13 receptor subunit alpha-2-like [Hypanus sabinus]|uniref:interleukin-13 receptor subunit alpha-2-like n=1 Tax=Hypanus sabinus TaxID=79690 RepID=UPI0028C4A9C9|nr:interleukin-13 receptor subunit alpha-2-like [Hypanus sabinus]